MTHRFGKSALLGAVALLLFLTACGVAASRTPLGGNYAVADEATGQDRTPSRANAGAVASAPAASKPATARVTSAAPPPAQTSAPVAPNENLLHYDPLRVGEAVRVEVSVSFELALRAGHQDVTPGDGKLALDAKYRFELKVTQASAQSLDELEVTVTPLEMRSHYGNHSSEAPLDPAQIFRVTLGRAPSVTELRGSSSDDEGRAVLLLLCTLLADFQEHWARSPSLDLRNAWSNTNVIHVPAFLNRRGEALQLGPAAAKYVGGEASASDVPFAIALPVAYSGSLGKLDFDLNGVARLSRTQARPLAIELRGPVNGGGGPHGELSARGFSKLNLSFSYL